MLVVEEVVCHTYITEDGSLGGDRRLLVLVVVVVRPDSRRRDLRYNLVASTGYSFLGL